MPGKPTITREKAITLGFQDLLTEKTCNGCLIMLPIENFRLWTNQYKKIHRRNKCNDCRKAQNKEQYVRRPKGIRVLAKETLDLIIVAINENKSKKLIADELNLNYQTLNNWYRNPRIIQNEIDRRTLIV